MIFDPLFTTAPQCVPSRAGYMTGRSTVAARNTRFSSPLPPDELTLPEVLREAGYYTGVCGRGFHLDGAGSLGPITKRLMDKLNLQTWDRRVAIETASMSLSANMSRMSAYILSPSTIRQQ
jgi:hypothetical protein